MTSIPVYVYVPVVLALLGLHMFTVLYAKRKIETLQAALVAKRVLLNHPGRIIGKRQQMAPGDSYIVKDKAGLDVIQIDAHSACDLSLRSFV